jgi:hypothetical protein
LLDPEAKQLLQRNVIHICMSPGAHSLLSPLQHLLKRPIIFKLAVLNLNVSSCTLRVAPDKAVLCSSDTGFSDEKLMFFKACWLI